MRGDDPTRVRDALLVWLAVTTGATDATAFVRLGHVFASVVTGNLVLLGVSGVQTDGFLALSSGCAIVGYALGVLVGSPRRRLSGGPRCVWPRATTRALELDLVLLVAFAVGWELDGLRPSRAVQIILLTIVATAMGTQSAAVRRMGAMSTTYLTSTTTGLIEALAARRWSGAETRGLGILVMAVAGAAAAVALILHAHRWLPAVQLVPLAAVLLAGRRLAGVKVPGDVTGPASRGRP